MLLNYTVIEGISIYKCDILLCRSAVLVSVKYIFSDDYSFYISIWINL